MRAALHLLLVICVTWCAVGLGEATDAYEPTDRAHAVIISQAPTPAPSDDMTGLPAELHHHHCPLAPDLAPRRLVERIATTASVPPATHDDPLGSVKRPPPLQPPAA